MFRQNVRHVFWLLPVGKFTHGVDSSGVGDWSPKMGVDIKSSVYVNSVQRDSGLSGESQRGLWDRNL